MGSPSTYPNPVHLWVALAKPAALHLVRVRVRVSPNPNPDPNPNPNVARGPPPWRPGDLPYISPISPYNSPTSPLYLPHICTVETVAPKVEARLRLTASSSAGPMSAAGVLIRSRGDIREI